MLVWWALSAVALLLHLWLPTGAFGDATYLLVTVGSVALAAAGARTGPAGRRLLPWLVVAGLGVSALGDVVWTAQSWAGAEPVTGPADLAYYASYVFLGAAMLVVLLPQRHDPRRLDVDAAIDVLTVVVVSVLVLWSVAARGILLDDTTSAWSRVVQAGYPVLDAVLLALVLRLLADRRHRSTLGLPFAVGVGFWLFSDLGWLVPSVSETVLDLGWMASAALMAEAAWRQPPIPEAGADTPTRTVRASLGQLVLAMAPLLLPLVLLVVTQVRGDQVRPASGILAMVAVFTVTFLRIARLLAVEAAVRQELARARDEALAASRAKSEFLATMSHEIRTPMNGVIGLTELLMTTPLDEQQQQYADGVRTAGRNLLEVINSVLDYSRIESGHLELEQVEFDLLEVVEGVAALVGEPAQLKGLELLAYCSPELPTALRGDPVRLRQVLLNLAGNAVKFTAAGEVVVRAGLESREGNRVVVRFEVRDTGIGLPEEDRERLFEPFSQADSSTTRQYGGTGLGLAICRRLVAAMGGTLGVDSTLGDGSTFWFAVPLEVATGSPVPAPAGRSSLDGLRVLVVDDNATNRTILHDQLRHWGMAVDCVDGAAEALTRLRGAVRTGSPYDLGVLDLCMPGVDGLELAERIGSDPDLAATSVVLMTSGPAVTRARARAASVDAALTKPVLMSRLRETLERVVAQRALARAPTAAAGPAGRPGRPEHDRRSRAGARSWSWTTAR